MRIIGRSPNDVAIINIWQEKRVILLYKVQLHHLICNNNASCSYIFSKYKSPSVGNRGVLACLCGAVY